MKTLIFRLALVLIFSIAFSARVSAQNSDNPSVLNKLLTDGEQEVIVDKLLQNVTFDNKTDWETSSDSTYDLTIKNGIYHMGLTGNLSLWGINDDSQDDTVIQVNTNQLSASIENVYGVMCRANINNSGDAYYFEISGDGYYSITKIKGDSATPLVDWDESKAINTGKAENEITAVCVGDYLAMYVNDVLVAETNDDTFTKGVTGLTAGAFADETDVSIEIDNVRIWSASLSSDTPTAALAPAKIELAESLTSYDSESKDAIKELEQLGMIPSGSSLIFAEKYAYFTGQGSWFTPLARRAPHKNIVMGGELTFTVGSTSSYETCSMTGRIQTNDRGTATTYVDVGIGNDSVAYIFDVFSEAQDGKFESGITRLNLRIPHHILFMLIDDVANLYVDGELEISNFKVAERSGTYGIALYGVGPKARCDGRNLWAYAMPNLQPGECAVTSNRNANKRTGPGTTFDTAGQLIAGDESIVSGQTKASDGKTWWQLEDETWVREDLVTANGDCANIPIIKPS